MLVVVVLVAVFVTHAVGAASDCGVVVSSSL